MNPNHPLGGASWMWPEDYYRLHNSYAQFRHDFRLHRVPPKAPFYITADQCYMLYVNGRYVGRGPARGYQVSWPYDEYDLAPVLARGRNWISVLAYNAGISTFQYRHEACAGLLCAARWGKVAIHSGLDWLMRLSPGHRRDTDRLSMQLNFQEHVDARQDDRAWIHSARPPAGWPDIKRSRPFGGMPWHDLEPRGIPNLGSRILPYQRTCLAATGPCGKGFQDWRNLMHDYHEIEREHLRWRPAAGGRTAKDGLVITLPATGTGRLAAVSVDLGQLSLGTLLVEAAGAAGGETIDFLHCEALNDDGSPITNDLWHACGASMAERLHLRPGRTRYEFFQMIGHRYLVAIARDTRRPIRLKLAHRETLYPLAIKGRFASSDGVLNDIYRISVRTQQVCMADSYMDTPWREQAQWWGDASVQVQNTFHLADDARLLSRGIRQIAVQEVPNGLTYGHAPTIAHNCILPDFAIIWALTLWDHYWQTGDTALFVEQWPRLQRLLGYFEGEGRGASGLLRYDPRYWLFLDWCQIHKDGTPTLLNLWYLLMLQKMAVLAKAAGMAAESRRLGRLHAEQKRRVLAKLWDRRRGLFRDGLTPDGRPVPVHSIHTQTLAILCGLQPKHHATMIARRLWPHLRGRRVPGAAPSSGWITYVYGVMRERGYGADVVRHIRRRWAPMIPYGGTWETFDGRIGDGSTSHAWAAHPIHHLVQTLGGVVQSSPAWRRILFAPVLDMEGVDRASVAVPTPLGMVRSAWRRRGGRIAVSLSLPRGMTADVCLPDVKPVSVTGANRWTVDG